MNRQHCVRGEHQRNGLHASFVIKCLNKQDIPAYPKQKLKETIFFTRRQPRIGTFFNNSKGKIGKQSIHNRLKFMDEITTEWHEMDLTDSTIRTMLKKTFFQFRD